MRLNRYLSQCGIASRRGAEQIILEGRVSINGHVITNLATQVSPEDKVVVDGKPVQAELPIVIAINKPHGLAVQGGTKTSRHVDRLLGTIYLPMSRLIVSATGAVAEASQWSVVVARNVNLSQQARLTINTDYEGSPVPVPIGVGNRAGGTTVPLRLRR